MVAQRGSCVDGFHDVTGEVTGMRGRETDAADSGDVANGGQELSKGEATGRITPGVHVLPKKLNVGKPLIRHAARFDKHRGGGAGALFTAGVRNDTIGAELVASLDDGDIAAVRIGSCREFGIEGLVGLAIVKASDAVLAGFEAGDHLRKITIGCGPGHERDIGSTLKDALSLLLGDTAENAKLLAFALHTLVLVEAVKDLLLGFIADGAGVVEDQAGFCLIGDLDIALVLQRTDDFFRVMGVHLAAEGFDIKRLAHRYSISPRIRKSSDSRYRKGEAD